MTYLEATEFVTMFLKGDNSSATVTSVHFRMALMEIATLCEPSEMLENYTGVETDVLRLLPSETVEIDFETTTVQKYIKAPAIPSPFNEDDKLPIDAQLDLAVVFFVCSYLSNKEKGLYENKGKRTISVYVSNEVK